MPEIAVCPEDRVFREVLLGDAALEIELQVARHFLKCEKCAARARTALASEQTRKAVRRRGEDRPLWQFFEDAAKLSALAPTVSRVEAMEVTQQLVRTATPTPVKETPLFTGHDDPLATKEVSTSLYAFLAPPESKDEMGRLGGYRVEKLLGAGGMGMVFQAADLHLQRKIALKVMRPEVAAVNNAKSRFLREARTMASIEHDYVVAVFQVGEDRGVPFMAMPFLQGMPLDAVLKKSKSIPLSVVLRMGFQIASGLAAAHAKGLIHRDIKPANIWIETQNNNRVKLLDFGLARGDQEDVQLTQSGSVLGTPSYMAPEQAAGGAIDARADLFSLGVVLYELTTLKRPFNGTSTMAVLTALAVHNPPPPCEIVPSVPENVSAFIMRLLEKDPARRVGSAQEAAKELAGIIKSKAAAAGVPPEESAAAETVMLAPSVPTVRAIARHRELAKPAAPSGAGKKGRLWAAIATAGLGAAALLLAVVTIFFRTPYGTLEIQIDDPNIEARFKNGALILADEKGATRYTLRPAAELADNTEKIKAGDYKLRVEGADGLTVETENFSLRDGKREIVKVILRPNDPPDAPTTPPIAAAPAADKAIANSWTGWPVGDPKPAIAPFDAAQARQYQQAWADHLKVPVEYTNSIGMKFILIPPGEYIRGATPEQIDQLLGRPKTPLNDHWRTNIKNMGPAHRVALTKPFYLSVTEVTQQQFETVMGANLAHFAATGQGAPALKGEPSSNLPIEAITWDEALHFTNQLGEREHIEACYAKVDGIDSRVRNGGYRLPTEAEWEFACRAGTTTRFYCGDDFNVSKEGWIRSNSGNRTRQVETLNANAFGLHDFIGNVWEWTEDGWTQHPYEAFRSKIAVDPQPDFGNELKVTRGGSYDAPADHSSSAVRDMRTRSVRHANMGMRVVLSVDAVRKKLDSAGPAVTHDQISTAESGSSSWKGWPTDVPKPAIAPFDTARARQFQQAWSDHLKVPIEYTNSIGMKFALIPPGEYLRGSTADELKQHLSGSPEPDAHWRENFQSATPQHKVILTKAFYLGVSEVTQEQYRAVMGANPSSFSSQGQKKDAVAGEATDAFPVDSVTWLQAAELANKLSSQERLLPSYVFEGKRVHREEGTGYRMPTEAEWEMACRAGTTTRFYCGDAAAASQHGWIALNSNFRTHATAKFPPNPFGLHDMIGNLWEWTEDAWSIESYHRFESDPAIDPAPSFAHSFRTGRGGAHNAETNYSGSAVRGRREQATTDNDMGVRLLLSVDGVQRLLGSAKTDPANPMP